MQASRLIVCLALNLCIFGHAASPITDGLQLHLDASVSASVERDGSGRVQRWTDLSGGDNHLVQADDAKKPLFSAGAIAFDGAASQFSGQVTLQAQKQGMTIMVALKAESGSSDNYVVSADNGYPPQLKVNSEDLCEFNNGLEHDAFTSRGVIGAKIAGWTTITAIAGSPVADNDDGNDDKGSVLFVNRSLGEPTHPHPHTCLCLLSSVHSSPLPPPSLPLPSFLPSPSAPLVSEPSSGNRELPAGLQALERDSLPQRWC